MGNKVKHANDFVAGGLVRSVAFLGDGVFAYTLHCYLQSFKAYVDVVNQVLSFLKPLPFFDDINKLFFESIVGLIMVYAIYILIRIYSNFILGVGPSQWALGLSGGRGFIWNRLGGVFRSVLEIFFTPFLIFDLPPWWGSPSLVERLSFTRIMKRSGLYTYVVMPVFLIAVIGLGFVAPLFFNLTLINDFKVIYQEESSPKNISKEDDFESFRHFLSNHFKFDAFASLKDERYVLLPSFDVTISSDAKKISPNLVIFDRLNKTFGTLRISKRISLLNTLSYGRIGNPLFSMKYPVLSRALNKDDKSFNLKNYEPQYGKNTHFSEKLKYEIRNLLKDSLKLNINTIYDHAFHNGPFIDGYVQIKNQISKIIQEGTTPRVAFEKIGNYEFLKITQKFEFSDGHRKNQYETLLPMDTENAAVLEFNYDDNDTSLIGWKNFKETFFASVVWYMDYDNIFDFPEALEECTPMVVVDYFATKELKDDEKKLLEDYVVMYFSALSQNALSMQEDELRQLLLMVLSKYESVIAARNIKDAGYYSEELIRKISSIKLALEVNNQEYFK